MENPFCLSLQRHVLWAAEVNALDFPAGSQQMKFEVVQYSYWFTGVDLDIPRVLIGFSLFYFWKILSVSRWWKYRRSEM